MQWVEGGKDVSIKLKVIVRYCFCFLLDQAFALSTRFGSRIGKGVRERLYSARS